MGEEGGGEGWGRGLEKEATGGRIGLGKKTRKTVGNKV